MSITRVEYNKIIQMQQNGQLTIMIDVAAWRQLLCDGNTNELKGLINGSAHRHIFMLRFLSLMWIPLLVLCVVMSIVATGWWAVAIGPAIIVGGFLYKARASMGRQSLFFISALLIGSFVLWITQSSWPMSVRTLVASLTFTVFIIRIVYIYTAWFVFDLVPSSYEFFMAYYMKPAETVGEVTLPYIWVDPEWNSFDQTCL